MYSYKGYKFGEVISKPEVKFANPRNLGKTGFLRVHLAAVYLQSFKRDDYTFLLPHALCPPKMYLRKKLFSSLKKEHACRHHVHDRVKIVWQKVPVTLHRLSPGMSHFLNTLGTFTYAPGVAGQQFQEPFDKL